MKGVRSKEHQELLDCTTRRKKRKGHTSRVNPSISSLQRAGWTPGKGRQMAHQATFSLAVLFRLIMPRQICGDTESFQHSTVKVLVW